MDPPPSDRSRSRRPFPVPERPEPEPSAPTGVHARDLIDQLPEPDPALVRDPGGGHRRSGRGSANGRRGRRSHRGRRSWPQRILLSVLVLATAMAGGAAAVGGYLSYKLDQIAYLDVELSQAPEPGAARNLLIVGSDSRDSLTGDDSPTTLAEGAFVGDGAEGSGQRSDTIIVVRVDPEAGSIDVLSIPRDLWLPIHGTGRSQRINTAYGTGPQRLIDTIESNFDLPIHHYVEIDFVGFVELVSAVGGVPVWFDTPVRDDNAGLRVPDAGCHVLDAEGALAFTRARHLQYQDDDGRWRTDPTGDLGRISRQQVFLRRSVDQVAQLGIGDAATMNRLLDVGIDSVTLDRGLGLSEVRRLMRHFADFDSDAMRTHAIPTESFTTTGGALVERVLDAEAQPALNVFRGLPPDALAPAQVERVTVLNGTGVDGHAALVADALEQVGFGVEETGDTDGGPLRRTRIRHAPDAVLDADLVERHLSAGAELTVDRELADGVVVLEVGEDFTTIGRNARPLDPPPPEEIASTVADPPAPDDDQDEPGSPDPIGVAPDPSVRCV